VLLRANSPAIPGHAEGGGLFRSHPTPTPRMRRPPLYRSIVASCHGLTIGSRSGRTATRSPIECWSSQRQPLSGSRSSRG
jgi:hypothetical protein